MFKILCKHKITSMFNFPNPLQKRRKENLHKIKIRSEWTKFLPQNIVYVENSLITRTAIET